MSHFFCFFVFCCFLPHRPEGSDRNSLWWQEFCSVFRTHESLEALTVKDSAMDAEAVEILAAALRHAQCNLRKLA